jgi:hypothetical protein
LQGGNLENGRRSSAKCGPPWRQGPANGNDRAPRVEKMEVEVEAHAEGVHAGTARDQEPRARLSEIEMREAEQARAKAGGDRHFEAEYPIDP